MNFSIQHPSKIEPMLAISTTISAIEWAKVRPVRIVTLAGKTGHSESHILCAGLVRLWTALDLFLSLALLNPVKVKQPFAFGPVSELWQCSLHRLIRCPSKHRKTNYVLEPGRISST